MEKGKLLMVFSAVLAVLILLNTVAVGKIYFERLSELNAQKKLAEPAKVELTLLTAQSCTDCYDMSSDSTQEIALLTVTKTNSFEYSSAQGKELATKYGITKFPTFILTGEIEKVSSSNFEKKENALIFNAQRAPYVNLQGVVKGKVSSKIIQKTTCKDCFDISQIITSMESAGIVFAKKDTIDADSAQGKELISKYNIKKLPFAIFDSELGEYSELAQAWESFGEVIEGNYIYSKIDPPYYDIASGKTEGLITLTMLNDSSCTDCYSVSDHRQILEGMGVALNTIKTVDISSQEGKFLIKKYNITAVPTIIISKEGSLYPVLVQSWEGVGTIEQDGSFVFRGFDVWSDHKYKDLKDGQVK